MSAATLPTLDYILARLDEIDVQKAKAEKRLDLDVTMYLAGYRAGLVDVLAAWEGQP